MAFKTTGGAQSQKENLERNKVRGGVDVEIVGVVVDALRCEMGHGAGAVLWAGSPGL